MKSRLIPFSVFLMLTMFACVAWGQGLPKDSVSAGEGDVVAPMSRDDTEIWCQTWTGCPGAWTSQIDSGPNNISGECVEDFTSNTDYAATSLVWWGARREVSTTPDYFLITFYAFGSDCTQPDTGTILSQQTIHNFNELPWGAEFFYIYSANLDPVLMDLGRTYWISIRAGLFVEGDPEDADTWSTQWFWAMNDQVVDCPGLFRGDFFGQPDWNLLHSIQPDYPCTDSFAFCLYTDMAVATDASSWGAVKSLYR